MKITFVKVVSIIFIISMILAVGFTISASDSDYSLSVSEGVYDDQCWVGDLDREDDYDKADDWNDADTCYTYVQPEGCFVWKVEIKAGNETYVYMEDGSQSGPSYYIVTFDAATATVKENFVPKKTDDMKDISHVNFYYQCDPPEIVVDVRPIFECWKDNGDGSYTAYFGYENHSTIDGEPHNVTIPVGDDNYITPASYSNLLPTEFVYPGVVENRPGRTAFDSTEPNAFVIDNWDGTNVVWNLLGKTSTAGLLGKECPCIDDTITIRIVKDWEEEDSHEIPSCWSLEAYVNNVLKASIGNCDNNLSTKSCLGNCDSLAENEFTINIGDTYVISESGLENTCWEPDGTGVFTVDLNNNDYLKDVGDGIYEHTVTNTWDCDEPDLINICLLKVWNGPEQKYPHLGQLRPM